MQSMDTPSDYESFSSQHPTRTSNASSSLSRVLNGTDAEEILPAPYQISSSPQGNASQDILSPVKDPWKTWNVLSFGKTLCA